jgi:hypothetical protein
MVRGWVHGAARISNCPFRQAKTNVAPNLLLFKSKHAVENIAKFPSPFLSSLFFGTLAIVSAAYRDTSGFFLTRLMNIVDPGLTMSTT